MLNKEKLTYPYHTIEGVSLPLEITDKKLKISRTLPLRQGDVCIVSHPRSGSNWLARIVILLLNQGESKEDKTSLDTFIYADGYFFMKNIEAIDFERFPSPRVFKMLSPYHFGLGGVPAQTSCKYLYIARNPKDVALSYYYFEESQNWWNTGHISWNTWIDMFIEGISHRGPWSEHVAHWWKHSLTANNILFVKYEDLIENYDYELQRIATFLDCLLTPKIYEDVKAKTNIAYMKKDPFYADKTYQHVLRKGGIGGWHTLFTDTQSQMFDEYLQKNITNLGLKFSFE